MACLASAYPILKREQTADARRVTDQHYGLTLFLQSGDLRLHRIQIGALAFKQLGIAHVPRLSLNETLGTGAGERLEPADLGRRYP